MCFIFGWCGREHLFHKADNYSQHKAFLRCSRKLMFRQYQTNAGTRWCEEVLMFIDKQLVREIPGQDIDTYVISTIVRGYHVITRNIRKLQMRNVHLINAQSTIRVKDCICRGGHYTPLPYTLACTCSCCVIANCDSFTISSSS